MGIYKMKTQIILLSLLITNLTRITGNINKNMLLSQDENSKHPGSTTKITIKTNMGESGTVFCGAQTWDNVYLHDKLQSSVAGSDIDSKVKYPRGYVENTGTNFGYRAKNQPADDDDTIEYIRNSHKPRNDWKGTMLMEAILE